MRINVYYLMLSICRKRKLLRYSGDFTEQDLETPRKRKMFWNAYRVMCQEHKMRIRCLEPKARRLQLKVNSLNSLADDLQNQNKTNAIGSYMLKVIPISYS